MNCWTDVRYWHLADISTVAALCGVPFLRPSYWKEIAPCRLETPSVRYVLSVDRKFKTQFETSEDAMAAGLRLKQTYPVLQVEVFDAAASSNFRMSSNQLCMADVTYSSFVAA